MAKPSNHRLIVKAATSIHAALTGSAPSPLPGLPAAAWEECCRLRRLLEAATRHGRFPLAVSRLRTCLQSAANRLQLPVDAFANDRAVSLARILSVYDVAEEVEALHAEFDAVHISCELHTVTVTTDPIELEGVNLGRFRITLDWQRLDEPGRACRIQALNPNPAATCDSYSHPHVDGETLCSGDGKAAIAAALSQGRICDVFVLVRQILNTSNSGSAYVQLDDWFASECRDCGDTTSRDNMRQCDCCDAEICRHCVSSCGDCNDDFCSDCTSVCAVCDSQTCATCLSECNGCGRTLCERCLTDDECSACQEERETEETATSEAVPLS